MIKMLIKEIIEINHVDRFRSTWLLYIVIIASLLAFLAVYLLPKGWRLSISMSGYFS